MIRDDLKAALVSAMKGGDKPRVGTIRLIQSAIKNRDIELRGKEAGDDDVLITEVLQKMIKQRRESIDMYNQGGRAELADAEAAEIAVIGDFLPRQLSDRELGAAIEVIVDESGATSLRDMGRVMAALKDRHAGQVDMAKAGQMVRGRLN